jgi:outer membrane protein assembly factor BamB
VLLALLGGAVVVAALVVAVQVGDDDGSAVPSTTAAPASPPPATASERATTAPRATAATTAPAPTAPTTAAPSFFGFVDPRSVGGPYSGVVPGSLTFRGNPTRTYYGAGPVPTSPEVLWQLHIGCSQSSEFGRTETWCGTGWTGQPAVFERDGRTWVVFGAYDRAVHFLDAETGAPLLADFQTGDIIKGSVTIDPDGYPLVYFGSRDGNFRVVAIDRPEPTELWRLNARDVGPTLWNDDWDGAGIVLGDYLFEGGENSRFHIVRLNRATGPDGLVTVDPEVVFDAAGWDDELLRDIGSENVSIESSVAVSGNVVYFANSGGLVQGWDVGGLHPGTLASGTPPQRVFRFWTGDDTDASVVVDEEGMLYVASEYERHTGRSQEVGQIMKLDPRRPDDPLVWSVKDQDADVAGVWATPALHRDVVYVATNGGVLMALDRATGEQRWAKQLPGPTWQSPVVVDDVLIEGDCAGTLHAYDVRDTTVEPPELWALPIGGCIESTPTVWGGRIFLGSRSGWFQAIGDR